MSSVSQSIALRAAIAGIVSVALTLATAVVASHFFGGEVAGTGLLLCIICPLFIGVPASAFQFWQQDRLRGTKEALASAKSELEQAHAELSRAYRALKRRATRDGLTGILNREAFTALLRESIRARPGTLLFLDADNFKGINDRYGHPTGDRALCAIAGAIATAVGASGLVGRIGGEEFAVFMPEGAAGSDVAMAETIRLAIGSLAVTSESGAPVGLTVSIGGASTTVAPDMDRLWRVADGNLYRAKAMGRNRVVMDDMFGDSQQTLPLWSAGLRNPTASSTGIHAGAFPSELSPAAVNRPVSEPIGA